MRLKFYVEGETEQTFVRRVLAPHFYSMGAHQILPVLVWSSRKKPQVTRGGGRNWGAARKGLRSLLLDQSADVRFTTMFDLYALFDDFPGMDIAQVCPSRKERVDLLEKALAIDMNDRRLVPYIQLHEFEAVLFSDCRVLGEYHGRLEKGKEAERQAVAAQGPEGINDHRETAPSKRIKKLFPNHRKRLDGIAIAERIGLATIRSQCPHFDDWITRLEKTIPA